MLSVTNNPFVLSVVVLSIVVQSIVVLNVVVPPERIYSAILINAQQLKQNLNNFCEYHHH